MRPTGIAKENVVFVRTIFIPADHAMLEVDAPAPIAGIVFNENATLFAAKIAWEPRKSRSIILYYSKICRGVGGLYRIKRSRGVA
jgi:hypothetical protein